MRVFIVMQILKHDRERERERERRERKKEKERERELVNFHEQRHTCRNIE